MFHVEQSDSRVSDGDVSRRGVRVAVVPVHNNIERRIRGKVATQPGKDAKGIVDISGRYPSRHGDFGTVGWADPVDPELVLVGENLFLRAGRFGAFATDATLEQVAQVIRRAYREFVEAARD